MTENWTKSSYSCGENNCVEVKGNRAGIGVRDSKDVELTPIRVEGEAWQAFVDGLRASA